MRTSIDYSGLRAREFHLTPSIDWVDANDCYIKAIKALGPLSIGQTTDLLADNFPMWPLPKCRALAEDFHLPDNN